VAPDSLGWSSTADELDVFWGAPAPYQTSGSPNLYPQGQGAHQGYEVTSKAQIVVDVKLTGPITTHPVSVVGHPAILSTTARPPSLGYGVQAVECVSRQLPDGRYIHVWLANADTAALLTFAGSLVESPETLRPQMLLGLTLPGLMSRSLVSAIGTQFPTRASMELCPSGTLPDPSTTGLASKCLSAWIFSGTNVARLSLNQTVPVQVVRTGGLEVQTYPGTKFAYAGAGQASAIVVQAPAVAPISAAELAAIVSSVRFDPAIEIKF